MNRGTVGPVRSNGAPRRPARFYRLSAMCQPTAEKLGVAADCIWSFAGLRLSPQDDAPRGGRRWLSILLVLRCITSGLMVGSPRVLASGGGHDDRAARPAATTPVAMGNGCIEVHRVSARQRVFLLP